MLTSKFTSLISTITLTLLLSLFTPVLSYPSHAYESLARLPRAQLDQLLTNNVKFVPPPYPVRINDTSLKLVNDKDHPWKPLRKGDLRGTCPGLNTLASHGYLPRNGIVTPQQIIYAVQEAFNMKYELSVLLTYSGFLVDGNIVNNLISIGGKANGPADPPLEGITGMDTHGTFEGDASLSREDAYLGNNHDFSEALFQQFIDVSNKYGAGKYNLTVASELRYLRIQQSIANNPTFDFVAPRYMTAYGESTFPVNFFIDGRQTDGQLSLSDARSFFQHMRMPHDFHRPPTPRGNDGVDFLTAAHPIQPGRNVGKVNNYVVDPNSATFENFCPLYYNFLKDWVQVLYPNPKGALLEALKYNLRIFYIPFVSYGCTEMFPYGK